MAYNGYTSAAKVSSIKSNFKMVTSYVSAELKKCDLGNEYFFNDADRFKLICGTGQHSDGSVSSSLMYMLDSSEKGFMDKSVSTNKGSNVDDNLSDWTTGDFLGNICSNIWIVS